MDTQTRQIKGSNVQRLLSQAVIGPSGTTKLAIVKRGGGNTGNEFTRTDGTVVYIFNVLAFSDKATADAAAASWKLGMALEAKNDLDGAQEHYKNALNSLMSFSVLKAFASAFQSAYEIACKIEMVPTGEETQKAGGPKTTLGIQNPSPIAIAVTGTSAASLFSVDDKPTTGATSNSGQSPALKNRRNRIKKELA